MSVIIAETAAIIAIAIAVLGFLRSLHRDIDEISEQIARIEGKMDRLASGLQLRIERKSGTGADRVALRHRDTTSKPRNRENTKIPPCRSR